MKAVYKRAAPYADDALNLPAKDSDSRIDKFGDTSYCVFFVVAPDGLCYMIGERQ